MVFGYSHGNESIYITAHFSDDESYSLYPEKAIKLGLNEENITLRKKSVTIEIDLQGD